MKGPIISVFRLSFALILCQDFCIRELLNEFRHVVTNHFNNKVVCLPSVGSVYITFFVDLHIIIKCNNKKVRSLDTDCFY